MCLNFLDLKNLLIYIYNLNNFFFLNFFIVWHIVSFSIITVSKLWDLADLPQIVC
eukprot:UN04148